MVEARVVTSGNVDGVSDYSASFRFARSLNGNYIISSKLRFEIGGGMSAAHPRA